jgi:hypothetical protein
MHIEDPSRYATKYFSENPVVIESETLLDILLTYRRDPSRNPIRNPLEIRIEILFEIP